MAIGGAALLVVLSVVNQMLTKSASRDAGQSIPSTMSLLMDARRNSEAAAAMSMGDDLCKRWGAGYVNAISHARDQADQASIFGAISKALRLVLQSGILALGAYLVIDADMSPGGMMACSIILARALAPIDQVIAYSRGTAAAWQALKRLRALSATLPKAQAQQHGMPRPQQVALGARHRDRAAGRHGGDGDRRVLRNRVGRRARHHRAERLRQIHPRPRPRRRLADRARGNPLRRRR